jgi:hypothetical protein
MSLPNLSAPQWKALAMLGAAKSAIQVHVAGPTRTVHALVRLGLAKVTTDPKLNAYPAYAYVKITEAGQAALGLREAGQ